MIQLQFLNRILKSKDISLVTINNIDKSFFSDYKDEFQYIFDHYTTYGNVPDTATFLSKFKDFDITEVNESDRFLLDELYKDKKTRMWAETFNRVKDLIMSGRADEVENVTSTAMEKIANTHYIESVDIVHNQSRYDKYIEKSEDFKKYYLKTGFDELDKVIGGWDRNEELATIIARPNVGKSWILLKVALAAAKQGLKVGLYSGEMSEDKVGCRLDTLYGHISNTKISHGNRDVQNDYKKVLDELGKSISGQIRVITPKSYNGMFGVNALRSFIEREKLDMLCIDQHSLLEDDRGARDPIVRASNISKDLKRLQVLKRIPIISVSQANRMSVNKGDKGKDDYDDTLDLENIAQSDRIGQDSTIVIGLTYKDKVLSMKLIKSRDSGRGDVFKYAMDYDKGLFTYIPSENDFISDCNALRDMYEDDSSPISEAF